MSRAIVGSLAVLFWAVTPSLGTPVIVVGDHELQPDQAGQPIQIFVSGGDLVEGLNFYVQVADGGPEAGGSINGPAIQDLDILTGTIFETNNTGQVDPEGSPDVVPQWEGRTTTTQADTVAAAGLLGTMTFDTTGFHVGTWDLFMSDTHNGPTDFAGDQAAITDGTITIRREGPPPDDIPEPVTAVLIPLGGLGLAWWRRRTNARG